VKTISKAAPIRAAKGLRLATELATNAGQRTPVGSPIEITVVGAGILGLWQALTLARAGHRVRLVEQSATPFADGASRYAGTMLAPGCESEAMPQLRATYPGLFNAGSLVVAAPRDHAELLRFARATAPPQTLDGAGLAALEPDLSGRFGEAYYFPDEAHMATPDALAFLLGAVRAAGASVELATAWREDSASGVVIDCRGMAAAADLPRLRGVRGERLLIRTDEIRLSRPVRLLHPRQPLYVVPWGDGRFLVGATVIESEDTGPITVRSAMELLGAAYALHPAFGEAAVLETGAGIRPAFPDNLPSAEVRDGGRRIMVNGAHRNGFLLGPVLAEAVAGYLANQSPHPLLAIP
jgi:glycine oxidase